MRDTLPTRPNKNECIILNHDLSNNEGNHWTAMAKIGKSAFYFDSFGNFSPPYELISYIGDGIKINYNYNNYQKFNTVICGQLRP